MSDAVILAALDAAFEAVPRPAHFTDFGHCCECAEHDATLCARDRDTLTLEDVGNPGWDPLCFCSAEGIAWYLPALARLALAAPDARHGWYGEQLVFHLTYDDDDNRVLRYCNASQRDAMVGFIEHVLGSRAALIDDHAAADDWLHCHTLWRAAASSAALSASSLRT